MSDEADCRTAPATPGLLIIMKDKYQAPVFSFLLVFSLDLFSNEQVISKLWTSISRSNVTNVSNEANHRWVRHI